MLKDLEQAETNLDRASTLLRGPISQENLEIIQELIGEACKALATVTSAVREHLKEALNRRP